MSKDKREPRYYEGIEYESNEELLVIQWLLELQEAGYVEKIGRAQTFELSTGWSNSYYEEKQLKTKTKEVLKVQTLMQGHVYTPEFRIVWNNDKLVDKKWTPMQKFTKTLIGDYEEKELVTYLEIKPAYDQNNMTRLFKLNQKWMYDKHGIYVNLLEPYSLFTKTFTPEAAKLTPTGKPRKVNWEPVRTIQEYLNTLV